MDGWTLEYDGDEKPFALITIIDGEEVEGWGLANPVIQEVNQGLGTCTFDQPGAEFMSEPIFEKGEIGIVRLDGVRKFWGEFRAPRRMGTSQASGFQWRLENPWAALQEITYRQVWNKYSDPEDSITELVTTYSTRVFLGQRMVGDVSTPINTDQQIIDIVNWAIDQGAPLALDEEDIPSCPIPVFEVRDGKCHECIIKMLQMAPDVVCFFDYTTEPYPTLKIKRRGHYASLAEVGDDIAEGDYVVDMDSVDLTPSEGTSITSVSVNPRDDLLQNGAIITYEKTTTVNGVPYRTPTFDIFPVGIADLEDGVPVSGTTRGLLEATVNLEGGVFNYATAQIVTAAINSNSTSAATRLAWWQTHRPDLGKTEYQVGNSESTKIRKIVRTQLEIDQGVPDREIITAIPRTGSLTYELTAGQYADWMAGEFEDETIEALASYEVLQEINGVDTVIRKVVNEPIQVKIKATSLTSGTYRSNGTSTPAEPVPVGMAEFIYNSTSQLQYDGELTICEREITGALGLGKVLNIMGGAEEFETMNGLIQTVTYNITTRETSVTFGPPKHLGPDDLVEMIRALRNRQRWTPITARATGVGGVGGATTLGRDNAKESNTTGNAGLLAQTWADPFTPTGATVSIDISELKTLLAANSLTTLQTGVIKPRLIVASRNNNGTCQNGRLIVIASEFIPD